MKTTGTLRRPFALHLSDKARGKIFDVTSYLYLLLYWYSAYEKLLKHARFEKSLAKSVLISDYATLFAWGVPITELAIGLLLMVPRTRRLGLWSATVTMVLFTLYIIYMLAMYRMGYTDTLSCHCNGFISKMSWTGHLMLNLGFVLMGLFALKIKNEEK